MVQVFATSHTGRVEAQSCQHHWLIETSAGPFSQGRCRRCRAVKSFKNYIDDFTKGEQRTEANTPTESANTAMSDDDEDSD